MLELNPEFKRDKFDYKKVDGWMMGYQNDVQ